MPFKPNYNHQRAERNRAKEHKKQEKRQRRDEEAARRKAGLEETHDTDTEPRATLPDSAPDNAPDKAPDNAPKNAPAKPSEDADGPQETTP